jgi:hypothetical protein
MACFLRALLDGWYGNECAGETLILQLEVSHSEDADLSALALAATGNQRGQFGRDEDSAN